MMSITFLTVPPDARHHHHHHHHRYMYIPYRYMYDQVMIAVAYV